MNYHIEETIEMRLHSDINDSFNLQPFVFNDKHEIHLNMVRNFVDYVKKLAESMSIIPEYNKIFSLFNVNYIEICMLETNSAADRVRFI